MKAQELDGSYGDTGDKLDLEVEGSKGISAAFQVHDCRECVGGNTIN